MVRLAPISPLEGEMSAQPTEGGVRHSPAFAVTPLWPADHLPLKGGDRIPRGRALPLTKPAKPIGCASWGRLSSPTRGEDGEAAYAR